MGANAASASPTSDLLVLHADVDAFFCQVEALRHPEAAALRGTPLAVQQHQDIISVDHSARQAGVVKHMAPAEARRLLAAVGGRVLHVYCEDGTRPSYRPYRETSAALMRLFRSLLPPGAVLERASIDEAFIALRLGPPAAAPGTPGAAPGAAGAMGAPGTGAGTGAGAGAGTGLEAQARLTSCGGSSGGSESAAQQEQQQGAAVRRAVELGERLRREALAQLGLRVSVGLAANKLLAKLASRAAKPDGLRVLLDGGELAALLADTPVARLPGMGGAVAEALAAAGLRTAADLRGHGAAALQRRFGLRPAVAEALAAWAHGVDVRPVEERGPPKAIQVQMTLTPVPRLAPAVMVARAVESGFEWGAVAGAGAGAVADVGAAPGSAVRSPAAAPSPAVLPPPSPSSAAAAAAAAATTDAAAAATAAARPMLMPLVPASGDGWSRLSRLAASMAGDLVARVLLDRHQEQRWPAKLRVELSTHGPTGRTASRTCAFPAPSLAPALTAAGAAGAAGAVGGAVAPAGMGGRSSSSIEGDGGSIGGNGSSQRSFGNLGDGSGVMGASGPSATAAGVGRQGAAAAAVAPRGASVYGQGNDAGGGGDGGGGGGQGLIVGEHTFFSPELSSALREAVVANCLALCGALLPPDQAALPLVQLHLTAGSFRPYRTLAAAGSIRTFLGRPPAAATAAAVGAAATAAAPATAATPAAAAVVGSAAAAGAATADGGLLPPAVQSRAGDRGTARTSDVAPRLAVAAGGAGSGLQLHRETPVQQQQQAGRKRPRMADGVEPAMCGPSAAATRVAAAAAMVPAEVGGVLGGRALPMQEQTTRLPHPQPTNLQSGCERQQQQQAQQAQQPQQPQPHAGLGPPPLPQPQQQQRPPRTRTHQPPRHVLAPAPPIDIEKLLAGLWPPDDDSSSVRAAGLEAGGVAALQPGGPGVESSAEADMAAWLAAFGAPALHEWWGEL